MHLDLVHFTPWASLLGGALIGLAAALLLLGSGRIAGISGILGGLLGAWLRGQRSDTRWRLAFLAGLMGAPLVWRLALPLPLPAVQVAAGPALLVAAGLLVGVGTRYAGGCTSGHGVCGLSRLSPRSVVATLSFMGAGFVVTGLVRHILAA